MSLSVESEGKCSVLLSLFKPAVTNWQTLVQIWTMKHRDLLQDYYDITTPPQWNRLGPDVLLSQYLCAQVGKRTDTL